MATISDVLEYLYKNDQKELAEAVLHEIKGKTEIKQIYPSNPLGAGTIKPFQPNITYC